MHKKVSVWKMIVIIIGLAMVSLFAISLVLKPQVTEYYWQDTKGTTYIVGRVTESKISDDIEYQDIAHVGADQWANIGSKDLAYMAIGMAASINVKGHTDGLHFKTHKVGLFEQKMPVDNDQVLITDNNGTTHIGNKGE